MNTNRISIITTVCTLIILISVPTIYKLFKIHDANLNAVVEKLVIETAKECYYTKECTSDKIYLKDLYALNKLERVSNPITKEYYNEESYVLRSGDDFEFIIVD